MSFRDKFLTLRDESNLSQQEAAELIGVSRQTVSRWEAGKSVPSTNQVANICKAFNIQANDLIESNGEISNADENTISNETPTEPSAKKKISVSILVVIGVLLFVAIGGLIITIVYAVKDAMYDTSSTVWIAAIPQNTPFVVLSIFVGIFVVLLAALLVYLLRSKKK